MAGRMARQYGVNFASYEREGKMTTWYGGKAFRRVHAIVAIQPGRTKADPSLCFCKPVNANVRRRSGIDRSRLE